MHSGNMDYWKTRGLSENQQQRRASYPMKGTQYGSAPTEASGSQNRMRTPLHEISVDDVEQGRTDNWD